MKTTTKETLTNQEATLLSPSLQRIYKRYILQGVDFTSSKENVLLFSNKSYSTVDLKLWTAFFGVLSGLFFLIGVYALFLPAYKASLLFLLIGVLLLFKSNTFNNYRRIHTLLWQNKRSIESHQSERGTKL